LVRHELTANSVALSFDAAPDLTPIRMSIEHIQGVWTNLILNALDALKNTSGPKIHIQTLCQDGNLVVTVNDNGSGIPPEKVTHIFDPFYTTKETGRGTGLGLTLCQRIVQHHGGHIDVISQVGKGTTFMVSLPTV
jgi:two-component system NtrC family sensor kinase